MTELAAPQSVEPAELLDLEQVSERVGLSIRNIRFYTSRGLIPAPLRRGRSAYYAPEHVARLELVQELQHHGFTLAAIEKYVASIDPEATAEEIAVHKVTLQPWMILEPGTATRDELDSLAGRPLSDDDLDKLAALDVVVPSDGEAARYAVQTAQMPSAIRLIDLEIPLDLLLASREVYRRHGQEIAAELGDIFRNMLWPRYRDGSLPAEQMVRMLESFQPVSIAALTEAFSQAMTEARREAAARRTR